MRSRPGTCAVRPKIISRVNFDRGRSLPSFQVSASAGLDLYTSEWLKMHLLADGEGLNGVLHVIDFGGLFSGNAIGPLRSFALRLTTHFWSPRLLHRSILVGFIRSPIRCRACILFSM